MPIKYTDPETLPAPVGAYSHIASSSAGGRIVGVAGQLAVDAEGEIVGPDDSTCARQLVQVFSNLITALEAEGLGPNDILQMTTYLITPDDIAPFYETRAEIFRDLFPSGAYPPNTLLVVQRLVRPEFRVEISAIAVA